MPSPLPPGTRYQSVVKVNIDDTPAKQARDITDGIGYACALLRDEYEFSTNEIAGVLEHVADQLWDDEARCA